MDDTLRSLLCELERFGAEHDARAGRHQDKMLNITPETGELLAILVQGTRARRVLEIGTSNGYSTLWLADGARAVPGTVVTVEVSAARAHMARQNIERAGLSPWVQHQVVDAGHFLRQQPPGHFDLIFLDARRDQYVPWWPWIDAALAPGGLLVADNALSHVAEMERFVALVRAELGWRSLVVPIGNGELVAVKPIAGL